MLATKGMGENKKGQKKLKEKKVKKWANEITEDEGSNKKEMAQKNLKKMERGRKRCKQNTTRSGVKVFSVLVS